MNYSTTAILALAVAAALTGPAAAQSMATPGPTPDSWLNAVPGPTGPSSPYMARPAYPRAQTYDMGGSGSSMPPDNFPMTSPDNPQAPLGAGGISTGGQYFAR